MADPNRHEIVRQSRCYACGQELASFAVLVCPECLDDNCDKFERLAKTEKEKPKRR